MSLYEKKAEIYSIGLRGIDRDYRPGTIGKLYEAFSSVNGRFWNLIVRRYISNDSAECFELQVIRGITEAPLAVEESDCADNLRTEKFRCYKAFCQGFLAASEKHKKLL